MEGASQIFGFAGLRAGIEAPIDVFSKTTGQDAQTLLSWADLWQGYEESGRAALTWEKDPADEIHRLSIGSFPRVIAEIRYSPEPEPRNGFYYPWRFYLLDPSTAGPGLPSRGRAATPDLARRFAVGALGAPLRALGGKDGDAAQSTDPRQGVPLEGLEEARVETDEGIVQPQ